MKKLDINKIIKELTGNKKFKEIEKKFPRIYFYSIFCILEKENFNIELNFYCNGKVFIFSYPSLNIKISKTMTEKMPEKIEKVNMTLSEIKKVIERETNKNNIKCKKAILYLYNNEDNGLTWNILCFSEKSFPLEIKVDDINKEVIKSKIKSFGSFKVKE